MNNILTLKEWRRAKGFSIERMAKECGVHANTYRTWEDKPSIIKLSKAIAISEALGVDLTDINFKP